MNKLLIVFNHFAFSEPRPYQSLLLSLKKYLN